MFILKLFDRLGNELSEGDFVKISDGRRWTFYAEVKYLKDENVITPFHTFSFHSFEKVNEIPKDAQQSTEERYKIYYTYPDHEGESDADQNAKEFEKYLMSWRECEHAINDRCFRIERLAVQTTMKF
jgi:hypothetical protein